VPLVETVRFLWDERRNPVCVHSDATSAEQRANDLWAARLATPVRDGRPRQPTSPALPV